MHFLDSINSAKKFQEDNKFCQKYKESSDKHLLPWIKQRLLETGHNFGFEINEGVKELEPLIDPFVHFCLRKNPRAALLYNLGKPIIKSALGFTTRIFKSELSNLTINRVISAIKDASSELENEKKPRSTIEWDKAKFLQFIDDSRLDLENKKKLGYLKSAALIDAQRASTEESAENHKIILGRLEELTNVALSIRSTQVRIIDYQEELLADKEDKKENIEDILHIFEENKIIFTEQQKECLSNNINLLSAETRALLTSYFSLKSKNSDLKLTDEEYKGLIDGCAFFSAFGFIIKSPTLQKIAGISSAVIQVSRHVGKIKECMAAAGGFGGLAVLSPYAAIGMIGLNLINSFLDFGPSEHEILMRHLNKLSSQIEDLHKDLKKQFVQLREYLKAEFDSIRYQLASIQYLIQGVMLRKLSDIEGEVKYVSHLVKSGFDDLLLSDLNKRLFQVKQYKKGIVPLKISGQIEPIKQLLKLAFWLKKQSYNPQFTGMLLINYNSKKLFRFSYKQCADLIYRNDYHTNLGGILPALLYIGKEVGLLDFPNQFKFPHTTLWTKAFHSYLDLRQLMLQSGLSDYDQKNDQLEKFENRLNSYTDTLKKKFSDKGFNQRLMKKLSDKLYLFESDLAKIFSCIDDSEKAEVKTVSQFTEFEIAKLEEKGKKGGLITDADGLGRQSFLSSEEIFSILYKKFPRLFDANILLAMQGDLITLKCVFHSSMAMKPLKNGKPQGEQYYLTEGRKYGPEVTLRIKGTHIAYKLTSPIDKVVVWKEANRKKLEKKGDFDGTRKITEEAHRKALSDLNQAVILDEAKLSQAIGECENRLKEKLVINITQAIENSVNKLNEENSCLYETMLWLHLSKLYMAMSKWRIAIDIDEIIKNLSIFIKAIQYQSINVADIKNIKDILKTLRSNIQAFFDSSSDALSEKKQIENSCLNELITCQLRLLKFQHGITDNRHNSSRESASKAKSLITLFKDVPSKSDDWAHSKGIRETLEYYLGKINIADVISPELCSIHTPLNSDVGIQNYLEAINKLKKDEQELKKPVVMVLNTKAAQPKSKTDALASGGAHWVACVILPKGYKSLKPSAAESNHTVEKVFFIDSLYESSRLPENFKNGLIKGLSYRRERQISDKEIKEQNLEKGTLIIDNVKISPICPNAEFYNCVNIKQQYGGSDCGWWAVYNSLMFVITGGDEFTKKFIQRQRAYQLREIFPNLALAESSISIKMIPDEIDNLQKLAEKLTAIFDGRKRFKEDDFLEDGKTAKRTKPNPVNPSESRYTISPSPKIYSDRVRQKALEVVDKVTPEEVKEMMRAAGNAELKMVKELLEKNPDLVYAQGDLNEVKEMTKDSEKKTYKNLTLFQYLWTVGHIGMCDMVIRYLPYSEATIQVMALEERKDIVLFSYEESIAEYENSINDCANWVKCQYSQKRIGRVQLTWPAYLISQFTETNPDNKTSWTQKDTSIEADYNLAYGEEAYHKWYEKLKQSFSWYRGASSSVLALSIRLNLESKSWQLETQGKIMMAFDQGAVEIESWGGDTDSGRDPLSDWVFKSSGWWCKLLTSDCDNLKIRNKQLQMYREKLRTEFKNELSEKNQKNENRFSS